MRNHLFIFYFYRKDYCIKIRQILTLYPMKF